MGKEAALIAGGSDEFTMELAGRLASDGRSLVLVDAELRKLESMAVELSKAFPVPVGILEIDLTRANAADDVQKSILHDRICVEVLINNFLIESSAELGDDRQYYRFLQRFETLAHLTDVLLSSMKEKNSGCILNVVHLSADDLFPQTFPCAPAAKTLVKYFSDNIAAQVDGANITVITLFSGNGGRRWQGASSRPSLH